LFFCENHSAGSLFVEQRIVSTPALWWNVRAYRMQQAGTARSIDGEGLAEHSKAD
jgi:hypothetical protein